jgi:hypothetical protein
MEHTAHNGRPDLVRLNAVRLDIGWTSIVSSIGHRLDIEAGEWRWWWMAVVVVVNGGGGEWWW